MKTWLRLAGWTLWLSGCVSANGPGSDTSTDWVKTCELQSECSNERQCGCGLCTHTCDRDSDCSDLSPTAVCADGKSECGSGQTVCIPDHDFARLGSVAVSSAPDGSAPAIVESDAAESATPESDPADSAPTGPSTTAEATSTSLQDDATVPIETSEQPATDEQCIKAFDLSDCCVGIVATTASVVASDDCMVPADGADLEQISASAGAAGCGDARCETVDCPGLSGRPQLQWLAQRNEAGACELVPGPCETSEGCGAEQACALGQCVSCDGLAELERGTYTDTFEGAADGCQVKEDCVYFARSSMCGDLACEWQTSTPIASAHREDLLARISADNTEICGARSTLGGCEPLLDCVGDSAGLYELECVEGRCVVPASAPNPCSLEGVMQGAEAELLDCGFIDLQDDELEPSKRSSAFECLLEAFDSCTPAILSTLERDQEGQPAVVQLVVTLTAVGCEIAQFSDFRGDPYTVSSPLWRSVCAGLEPANGTEVPVGRDCEKRAECSFVNPVR